jgi:alpha-L-rhamnosidase
MGLLTPDDWQGNWITASRWYTMPEHRGSGFKTHPMTDPESPAWAQVELRKSVRIDRITLFPNEASTFPLRFKVEAGDDVDFNSAVTLVDYSKKDFDIGPRRKADFQVDGVTASRVRILILKSPKMESGEYQSVIRQMQVWSGGSNAALMKPVVESGTLWKKGHAQEMVDGMPSANEGDQVADDACPSGTAPMLRKGFSLEQEAKKAVLYYAAHGMADISINGSRVDETVLGPRFSDYSRRIYYRTVDVTTLLKKGENAVGAVLGNGFFSAPGRGHGQRHGSYGPPRLLLQLNIEMEDGTRRAVVSDDAWRWSRSEIVFNDLWDGYAEDRRLAQPGWNLPGFSDRHWQHAAVTESLGGIFCAEPNRRVHVVGELAPDRVEDNAVFFEVLSAGWPKVTIEKGKAGQVIEIKGDHGAPCRFTLASDGPTTLEPRFAWGSGPTRLTITGLEEPLTADKVSIQLVRNDLPAAGSFQCSSPWFNTLHETVQRTFHNYVLDYPLDPMREKQGWTQDIQGFFNTACYLTDSADFYRRWWRDIVDNQRPNGLAGSIAPLLGQIVNDWNSPWWSGVIAWLPTEHYLYYGDPGILEEAYEPMKRYVDYLDRLASLGAGTRLLDYPDQQFFLNRDAAAERMLIWNGANDWLNPMYSTHAAGYANSTEAPLVSMAAWYLYADNLGRVAGMLGKSADAKKYSAMAEGIARRANDRFLDRAAGRYGEQVNNQTAQALPLAVGMVPPEIREQTFERLLEAIHEHDDHHATGFVTLPYLLQLLTESRRSGLANRIVNQDDYPSWKTLIHHGVMSEKWDGGGAQMPSCGGAVGMWFHISVLGVRPDPAGPGFKRFILAPQPDPASGLTWAKGYYDSIRGRIVSDWKIDKDHFTFHCEIPPNTTARVFIPTTSTDTVKIDGLPVKSCRQVTFIKIAEGCAVYEVGSGRYSFSSSVKRMQKPLSRR